jgi:hypothetical protein
MLACLAELQEPEEDPMGWRIISLSEFKIGWMIKTRAK